MSTSEQSLTFDGEDIAIGNDTAIISKGSRRFLIKQASSKDLEILRRLVKDRNSAALSELSENMRGQFEAYSLITSSSQPRNDRLRFFIPSRYVTSIARRSIFLVSTRGIALFSALLFAVFFLGPDIPKIERLSHLILESSFTHVASISAIYFLTTIAHEIGHAAACYKFCSICGHIRLKNYRGLPALAADVSCVATLNNKDKSIVAVSGPVFQIIAATLLLLIPSNEVRMGALLGILASLFAIVPLPQSDGYWFIRDYFSIDLSPSLLPQFTSKKTDVIYGWFLLIVTLIFSIIILILAIDFVSTLWLNRFQEWGIRHVFLLASGAYAFIVFLLFFYKNIKLINWSHHGHT